MAVQLQCICSVLWLVKSNGLWTYYSSRKHTRKNWILAQCPYGTYANVSPTEIVYVLFVCICANVNNMKYIAMDRICNNEISIARSQMEFDRLKNLDPILYVHLNMNHEHWTHKTFNIMTICARSFFLPISIQFRAHNTIYSHRLMHKVKIKPHPFFYIYFLNASLSHSLPFAIPITNCSFIRVFFHSFQHNFLHFHRSWSSIISLTSLVVSH